MFPWGTWNRENWKSLLLDVVNYDRNRPRFLCIQKWFCWDNISLEFHFPAKHCFLHLGSHSRLSHVKQRVTTFYHSWFASRLPRMQWAKTFYWKCLGKGCMRIVSRRLFYPAFGWHLKSFFWDFVTFWRGLELANFKWRHLWTFGAFCSFFKFWRERSHYQTLYDQRFFWKINNFLHWCDLALRFVFSYS